MMQNQICIWVSTQLYPRQQTLCCDSVETYKDSISSLLASVSAGRANQWYTVDNNTPNSNRISFVINHSVSIIWHPLFQNAEIFIIFLSRNFINNQHRKTSHIKCVCMGGDHSWQWNFKKCYWSFLLRHYGILRVTISS